MIKNVSIGNAATESQKAGGWFIGHFIADDPLRKTADVEVKWGIHPKGQKNHGGFLSNRTAKTMSVLVSGNFRLWFRDGDTVEQIDLDAPGKYALWMPGVPHDWEALQDSVVLTVRWPSLPKDQG